MGPNLEQQNDQSQQKQSGGGVSQGLNAFNNLADRGFNNPLGKIGSRAAVQVARSGLAALLANPIVLALLIVLVVVVVFTIAIIAGIGGAPLPETNSQQNAIPAPTQTPAP